MRWPVYSFSLALIRALRHQWIPALGDELTFGGRARRLASTPLALLDPNAAGEVSWTTLSASLLIIFLTLLFMVSVVKWMARRRELTRELMSTADSLAREVAERKETGRRLAVTSRAIEHSPVVVAHLRMRGSPSHPEPISVEYVSSNADQFGYQAEDLMSGKVEFFRDVIHPDDRARTLGAIAEAMRRDEPEARAEFRILKPDGGVRWVEGRTRFERDDTGQIQNGNSLIRDITERKEAEIQLQLLNTDLKSQIECSPDGILAVDLDRRITSCNRRFLELWSMPLEFAQAGLNDRIIASVAPLLKDPQGFLAGIEHLEAHPEVEVHDEMELKDGRVFERHSGTMRDASGRRNGRLLFFRDITDRKQAEIELRYRDAILHAVAIGAAEIMRGASLEEAMPGALEAVGRAMGVDRVAVIKSIGPQIDGSGLALAYAWQAPDVPVRLLPEHISSGPFNDPDVIEWQAAVTEGRPTTSTAGTVKGGVKQIFSTLEIQSNLRVPIMVNGAWWGVLGIDDCRTERPWKSAEIDTLMTLADLIGSSVVRERFVSDLKEAEQATLKLARCDALTGLPNRTVFVEALQQATARARRHGKNFAVLYLDLDHFKDVNDTLGHPVGDSLLKAVSTELRSHVRETDSVARFGGDEFAVLETDINKPSDAAVLAGKLLQALSKPFAIAGNEIHTGASIGIAIHGDDALDPETLLSHADVALYRAKAEGRYTFRFFTEAMDAEVRSHVTLVDELRSAIAAQQLFLVYQPQYEIRSGEMIGVEALVRWRHPRRGVVLPDEIIPAAEKSGIIRSLGHWALREACRQSKVWLDAGIAPAVTAVNVSAVQFKAPQELERDIAAVLAETGLPPERLELELTETAIMEAWRDHQEVLMRIRDMGVRIAIDDFGTGYSSLDYLRRLPVSLIKIAQTFVSKIATSPGEAAIVKAMIGLAQDLDLNLIAEGVETREQLELLETWDCPNAQGFYFSRPLPAEELTAVLGHARTLVPMLNGPA